ncbi:hypothetical protein [uncultured Chryseobacterium sp.]|uniref:hypothetical protein n=1 Tax=uncultured Chryseobacterium sp. TaxID=259322 RepID=UPI0026112FB5|nr:hypothetical protein [uncultured Chryseobacterium sp.]
MKKSILYLIAGTVLSFFLQYLLLGTQGWKVDLYNAFAFGLGWGMAYFVDRPEWPLFKKLGISFIGVALIVVLGLLLFDFDTAVPSIIKFSTVFVAYYLIASFRESKSLRQ